MRLSLIRTGILTLGMAAVAWLAVDRVKPLAARPTDLQSGAGPYQLAVSGPGDWVVLNTVTGRFEHWVLTGDRYLVETSQFGGTDRTEIRYVVGGRGR
jgi:hypothetical protein